VPPDALTDADGRSSPAGPARLEDDFADVELPTLHQRTYLVRAYRQSAELMRIRGAVQDIKPPGLYIADDPDPLEVHHMVVDLVVQFPSMEIVDANVALETHPHPQCVRIEDHYRKLIGLSIARGFTHKVRELFGGPRGCTHTTALLQAMAPVAIQSIWSLQLSEDGLGGVRVGAPRVVTPEQRQNMLRFNLNTCHVWDEEGEMMASVSAGEQVPPPLWAERRMVALGRDPAQWRERTGE
jgi:hypothetical protein